MYEWVPVAHFSGLATQAPDLTSRQPWVYVIAALRQKLLYVGETYDQGGLIIRLGSHFGPVLQSSLKQRALIVAAVTRVLPPFLVTAARLPVEDDRIPFEGSSKQARLLLEAVLHEIVASDFVSKQPGWRLISTPQPGATAGFQQAGLICRSIYSSFENSLGFVSNFSSLVPFQLVILDAVGAKPELEEADLGRYIEEIEVRIFKWVMQTLQVQFGAEWWSKGIPQKIRVQCVTRREEEGAHDRMPEEAFLTFVDLRDIIRSNWAAFSQCSEAVARIQGKDKGTEWLVELNEIRKLWAHPIKRQYAPVEPTIGSRVITIHERVLSFVKL